MAEHARDLLALNDLPAETILALLHRARAMRDGWESRRMPQALAGRRVALVVDDGGWRNTTAFELGIQAMGGAAGVNAANRGESPTAGPSVSYLVYSGRVLDAYTWDAARRPGSPLRSITTAGRKKPGRR